MYQLCPQCKEDISAATTTAEAATAAAATVAAEILAVAAATAATPQSFRLGCKEVVAARSRIAEACWKVFVCTYVRMYLCGC